MLARIGKIAQYQVVCVMKQLAIKALLGWLSGVLFSWWLFCKVDLAEMLAAAILSVLACSALAALARVQKVSFTIDWKAFLRTMLRLPRKAIVDANAVFLSLMQRTRPMGSYHRGKSFDSIGKPGAGNKAAALFAVSFPPNSYAISFLGESLLIHQLTAAKEQATEERHS